MRSVTLIGCYARHAPTSELCTCLLDADTQGDQDAANNLDRDAGREWRHVSSATVGPRPRLVRGQYSRTARRVSKTEVQLAGVGARVEATRFAVNSELEFVFCVRKCVSEFIRF